METKRDLIFNELVKLAVILGVEETEQRLQIMANMLAEHDEKAVCDAIRWAAYNLKFFPKPVELLERISPSPTREDADAIAGRAIEAIYRFGWNNSSEARLYVGPEGWKAISRIGGWRTLCDTPEANLGTLRAQLRDQCLSVMNNREVSRRESLRIEKNYGSTWLGQTQAARMKRLGVSDPDFMNDEYAVRTREFDQEKQRQLGELRKLEFEGPKND